MPSHIKNGFKLKKTLENIGSLPAGTHLFTTDATAMYTNINTDHGLKVMEQFLELFKEQLPDGFPLELVMMALRLVMKNNIFEFGEDLIKQLDGTAMGTPAACIYATLYYAFHEISKLLTKYAWHLLFYGRYLDDGLGLWHNLDNPLAWYQFCKDVNDFGVLK